MPNNQTKAITQGAMMIALFLVLMALAYYVPIVSIVAFFVAPLPLAWYSATYNRNLSIGVTIVAIVASIFIGNIMILPFVLILATTGLVIGDCLRQQKSKLHLFLATGTTILLTFAIQYLVLVRFFNVDFIKDSLDLARKSYEKSMEYSASITGQELPREQMDQMFNLLEVTLPANITISMFFLAFLMIAVMLPILKRLKINVPKFAPFRDMRLPRAILWYYLIVLSINLFVQPEVGSTLYVIVLNLSMVLWVLLTLQGISFIHFVIDTFNYPPFLKVLSTIVAIPLYSFVLLLGIIDLGFNLRDWVKAKSEK
ncbi:YybS family protein [Lysinibacillus sp. KU-BSD001]|uniref:YybS family protein n=1 Tax=Lysinibacillus sp. KU-BSD001 TaxID=3141328 RepID=UPI0036E2A603